MSKVQTIHSSTVLVASRTCRHATEGCVCILLETNMETPKGPYKDYNPSKMGTFWVSMLVSGCVWV